MWNVLIFTVLSFFLPFCYNDNKWSKSPERSGGGAGKERRSSLQLCLWNLTSIHLQFPCSFPSTEQSDFRQSGRIGNERECKPTVKKHVLREITSLLVSSQPISISHRLWCRWQMFKFQRRNCKQLFRPSPPLPRQSALEILLAG